LVEGPSDKVIIPKLARELNIFRHDYTLIDCGGKGNIPIYISLLNKFKLNYVAVYDKDHQSGKNKDAIKSADIMSMLIEKNIDKSLGKSIIFINDIEEEIGITTKSNKNKPFLALEKVSDSNYTITDNLKKKITDIYS